MTHFKLPIIPPDLNAHQTVVSRLGSFFLIYQSEIFPIPNAVIVPLHEAVLVKLSLVAEDDIYCLLFSDTIPKCFFVYVLFYQIALSFEFYEHESLLGIQWRVAVEISNSCAQGLIENSCILATLSRIATMFLSERTTTSWCNVSYINNGTSTFEYLD